MYVIIEGIDTAGKSTQISLLRQNLPLALFTKEPGGTDFGMQIRHMILNDGVHSKVAEMYLFLADRAEHYSNVILPNKDKLIISDRGLISGISYAMMGEFDEEFLLQANKLALQNTMPDMVIILELSKDELINRLSSKPHDKVESRGVEYLLHIQANMINTVKKMCINHIIIDASNSIDTIQSKILDIISKNGGVLNDRRRFFKRAYYTLCRR